MFFLNLKKNQKAVSQHSNLVTKFSLIWHRPQLLRAIAQLDPSHGGDVLLNDRLPEEIGFTVWRTRVAYVQQKQTRLTEATGGRIPREYFNSIMNLNAHKERRTRFADPMSFGRKWGLDDKCFESPWETMSPSEHQRMLLAIALACKPEVVLLDEPTGVLDMSLALMIEKTIRSLGLSVIWATRDVYQVDDVGCVCGLVFVLSCTSLQSIEIFFFSFPRRMCLTRQAERVGDTVIEFNSLTHIDLNVRCADRGVISQVLFSTHC